MCGCAKTYRTVRRHRAVSLDPVRRPHGRPYFYRLRCFRHFLYPYFVQLHSAAATAAAVWLWVAACPG